MKITELRINNLLEIVNFLDFNQMLTLRVICKAFFNLFEKYKFVLQEKFLILLGLPISNDYLPWKQILENMKASEKIETTQMFLPYYTNGGTWAGVYRWFIQNLTIQHGAYCTINEKNILIKYLDVKDMSFDYDNDVAKYLKNSNEYNIDDIEQHENDIIDSFPMIDNISLSLPGTGFTRPLKNAICFSSIEKLTDVNFFSKFYDCDNIEKVVKVAAEIGIKTECNTNQHFESITFERSSNNIQCLCWVNIDNPPSSQYTLNIRLMQSVFARYFYVVLIIGTKTNTVHHNIDTGPIIPLSKLIQLKKISKN